MKQSLTFYSVESERVIRGAMEVRGLGTRRRRSRGTGTGRGSDQSEKEVLGRWGAQLTLCGRGWWMEGRNVRMGLSLEGCEERSEDHGR